MGPRTDFKSPAIFLPFAVCYESPRNPAIPAPIFMRVVTMWPEVGADGGAHARAAGRLGLRLLLAPVLIVSLVALFSFPHIPPLSPSCSPLKLDFHNKCSLLFQFWQHWLIHYGSEGCTNTCAQDIRPCCPCHSRLAGVLTRERTISWAAMGRGEWLSWSFHWVPQERSLRHLNLPIHSKASWGSPQVLCLAPPYPPAELISHVPYFSHLSMDNAPTGLLIKLR